MTKQYEQMREEIELQEISLGRAGGTLFFASQVRASGLRLETAIRNAKSKFVSSKSAETIDDKIVLLVDGMSDIADALFLQRKMLGSITGLSLSAALTHERSDKGITKLLKGKRTR